MRHSQCFFSNTLDRRVLQNAVGGENAPVTVVELSVIADSRFDLFRVKGDPYTAVCNPDAVVPLALQFLSHTARHAVVKNTASLSYAHLIGIGNSQVDRH